MYVCIKPKLVLSPTSPTSSIPSPATNLLQLLLLILLLLLLHLITLLLTDHEGKQSTLCYGSNERMGKGEKVNSANVCSQQRKCRHCSQVFVYGLLLCFSRVN